MWSVNHNQCMRFCSCLFEGLPIAPVVLFQKREFLEFLSTWFFRPRSYPIVSYDSSQETRIALVGESVCTYFPPGLVPLDGFNLVVDVRLSQIIDPEDWGYGKDSVVPSRFTNVPRIHHYYYCYRYYYYYYYHYYYYRHYYRYYYFYYYYCF